MSPHHSTASPRAANVQGDAGHGIPVAGIIGAVGNNGKESPENWNVGIITAGKTGTAFTTLDLATGIDYIRP